MKETVADTGKQLPGQIAWTDDKGEEHLVKQVSHDSVTGENMTLIELSEVTVMAKSKQVAERNGKINLDFLVTVPGELINNKWQVQLTPVAYKPSDTLYLDKIFLSGADFAKMQEKGYMRYRVFMNSIIPDSLYMQRLLDSKGYKKALAELEEEYFQAWKHEVIAKERWVDWSDKTNARFALFNYKMERNRQAIAGYNSILESLPAYWMRREIDGKYIPSKWKMFAEGNYKIRTRSITPEDSAAITERFTDYKKIAENQKRKEQAGAMYEKYVRFPYEPARLDTVIRQGNSFVYYYKQELPATENTKKIELTLDGQILSRDEVRTQLPPSDTITYYISSMVQFLDRTPRYRKKIITRKDEVSLRAYVTYKTGSTGFDEKTGNNKAEIDKDIQWVYSLFPRLEERSWQLAGTLSGGEQQMLAVGRALMSRPKLLLLDEPSLGLAPLVVQDIFKIIQEINRQGVTVLLVEQNANMALKIADLAYVLETGTITMSGTGAELLADSRVKEAYLGRSN